MNTLILILIICLLGGYAFFAFMMANADKFRYEEAIIYLENYIRKNEVNEANFRYILQKFDELQFFNLNRERTAKAFNRFCKDYVNFWAYLLCNKKTEYEKFVDIHNEIMSA